MFSQGFGANEPVIPMSGEREDADEIRRIHAKIAESERLSQVSMNLMNDRLSRIEKAISEIYDPVRNR